MAQFWKVMTIHRKLLWRQLGPWLFVGRKAAALVILVALSGSWCLKAADVPTELTLPHFLSLIRARSTPSNQAAPLSKAEEVFRRLLRIQGQEAATQQSLDRLSGWSKVIQARFEAQHASALDVEMVRFANSKVAAELAQLQADRLGALREANLLLGKTPDAPLVALAPPPFIFFCFQPKGARTSDPAGENSGSGP
ncbi:MAG: hypothetical protein HY647_07335 [Acidobacteria bacterium]|nr:hypothetical protein [Acidobacteriota bacterium]